MSYDIAQSSAHDSAPVELFVFSYYHQGQEEAPLIYRYNSTSDDFVLGGITYSASGIYTDKISKEIGQPENTVTVYISRGTEIWDLFSSPLRGRLTVDIYGVDFGDTGSTLEQVFLWDGEVVSSKSQQDGFKSFECESISAQLRASGLNRTMSRQCPYVVYQDSRCGRLIADAQVISTEYTITGAVTMNIPEIASSDDGFFAGGFIEYTNSVFGGIDRVGIRQSVLGGNINLDITPSGLSEGVSIKVVPGCSGTRYDCKNKHNNLDNYGGQPDLPRLNPFGPIRIF